MSIDYTDREMTIAHGRLPAVEAAERMRHTISEGKSMKPMVRPVGWSCVSATQQVA